MVSGLRKVLTLHRSAHFAQPGSFIDALFPCGEHLPALRVITLRLEFLEYKG